MISVIIPVYNAENYLRDCVESVQKQTYTDLQILIVNDGSTDTSSSICDTLAAEDNRIQVIHQTNRGVSAARNAGLDAAKGELISFVDADDTLDQDMYEFLVGLMEKYEADIAHCAYRHIVGDEVRLVHDTKQTYLQTKQEALQCLIEGKLFAGSLWNKLYRREILCELRFDESLKINEDILFNYFAFKNARKTVFEDSAKYNYIAHKSSSASFVTSAKKKHLDSSRVNEMIYYDAESDDLRSTACSRYIRSLSTYYRSCCTDPMLKAEAKKIRKTIWQLYRDNRHIGKKTKAIVYLIHYVPRLYSWIYLIYKKLHKPNWEVKNG